MKVMLPSLCSFFILTAGFYVLHGYTSLKSVIKVQGDNDLAVSFLIKQIDVIILRSRAPPLYPTRTMPIKHP